MFKLPLLLPSAQSVSLLCNKIKWMTHFLVSCSHFFNLENKQSVYLHSQGSKE